MPTPAQRKYMIERIRHLRSEKSDIPFYPMDFQNDGEFVGGCIAGGRNYFHINSAGDAERASSSTTPTPTSTTAASSIFSAARSSWPTTTASPSIKTICVPARCWKTPSFCARWCMTPVLTARLAVARERRPSLRQMRCICGRLAACGRRDLVACHPQGEPVRELQGLETGAFHCSREMTLSVFQR